MGSEVVPRTAAYDARLTAWYQPARVNLVERERVGGDGHAVREREHDENGAPHRLEVVAEGVVLVVGLVHHHEQPKQLERAHAEERDGDEDGLRTIFGVAVPQRDRAPWSPTARRASALLPTYLHRAISRLTKTMSHVTKKTPHVIHKNQSARWSTRRLGKPIQATSSTKPKVAVSGANISAHATRMVPQVVPSSSV